MNCENVPGNWTDDTMLELMDVLHEGCSGDNPTLVEGSTVDDPVEPWLYWTVQCASMNGDRDKMVIQALRNDGWKLMMTCQRAAAVWDLKGSAFAPAA